MNAHFSIAPMSRTSLETRDAGLRACGLRRGGCQGLSLRFDNPYSVKPYSID